MKHIEFIIFDIDGTILPGNGTLPKSMLTILNNLIKKGIKIGFATGRNYNFGGEVAEQIEGDCYLGFNNGSVIVKYPEKKVLIENSIPSQVIEDVRIHFEERNISCLVNSVISENEKTYIFNSPPSNAAVLDFAKNIDKDKQVINNINELNTKALACLYASIPSKIIHSEYEFIKNKYPDLTFTLVADPIFDGFHWLGFMPSNTGKQNLLHYVSEHLDIPIKNIMAAGDDYNDQQILKEAGIGIAMGTSPDEVKESADIQIGSAEDKAMEKFLLESFF
ncbi:MAG: hypothetical protein COA79_25205 [Planctomycetota bacterium]|nr:MAG: hypothetical protein COA79_25205 [Planctomycetota bacterium]